jgi:putative hydrolase of the HAD superfamily
MAKVKAMIFDLDNTLIDFMGMKQESCRAAVEAMIAAGLKMNRKVAYRDLMECYFRVGIESEKGFEEFLRKETGKVDSRILAAAINAYLKAKDQFMKPYPNVEKTLQRLEKKGISLVIVTDAPKVKAYQRLLAMGIEKYFSFVIGFEDTGQKKSTGIPIKLAIGKLGLRPAEVMMIGDSLDRDIGPAQKMGMKTALAKYGQTEDGYGNPDYAIDGIEELLDAV